MLHVFLTLQWSLEVPVITNVDTICQGLYMLLLLLQASGQKWDSRIETQLCYELKTFLLAGHETSAAMLMWSVYELSRNPEARAKVSAGDHEKGSSCGL